MHDGMPHDPIQGQGHGHAVICDLLKRIPRWLLRGADRQSRTGLIFHFVYHCEIVHQPACNHKIAPSSMYLDVDYQLIIARYGRPRQRFAVCQCFLLQFACCVHECVFACRVQLTATLQTKWSVIEGLVVVLVATDTSRTHAVVADVSCFTLLNCSATSTNRKFDYA